MSGLTSVEAVYIALVFIVPGYIFLSLRNQFVAGQDKLSAEQVIAYVAVSGINFAIFGWLIYLAYALQWHVAWKALVWTSLAGIFPAAGRASAYIVYVRLDRRLFGKGGNLFLTAATAAR